MDHGEKSNRYTNRDVEKLGLIDFEDCLNYNREVSTSALKGNQLISGIPESSGQKLQLQMEIYRDLSEFYQHSAGKTHPIVADELNTPVFEKAHFDYDRQLHSSDLLNVITSKEDQQNSKIKIEIPNTDSVNIEDMNNILIHEDGIASESKDLNLISADDKDATKLLNYLVISSQGINSNQSNKHFLDNAEYEYMYHDSNKVTPMLKGLVYEDDDYLPTVNNYSDIFFNNNDAACVENLDVDNAAIDLMNDQYIVLDTSPIESPETSIPSESESSYLGNPFNLQLDCSKIKLAESLNTPDVIEAIDAIDIEKGFNILHFITDDNPIKVEPTISTEDVSLSSTASNDFSTPVPKQTRKRKVKTEDDDDEDYEPPLSFIKHFSSPSKKQKKFVHSDIVLEREDIPKSTRRGRPPKPVSTVISTKVCIDDDEKYREMRDKNNEASRKSRLKRKLKETAQEEEAYGLEERNVKLKAQVTELERTVNNFRTNLMQLLMKK